MSAFGATLDWHNERSSFANSSVVIPVTHHMYLSASMSAHSHTPSANASTGSTSTASISGHIAAGRATARGGDVTCGT